jgi:hypothetical protein
MDGHCKRRERTGVPKPGGGGKWRGTAVRGRELFMAKGSSVPQMDEAEESPLLSSAGVYKRYYRNNPIQYFSTPK